MINDSSDLPEKIPSKLLENFPFSLSHWLSVKNVNFCAISEEEVWLRLMFMINIFVSIDLIIFKSKDFLGKNKAYVRIIWENLFLKTLVIVDDCLLKNFERKVKDKKKVGRKISPDLDRSQYPRNYFLINL